MNIFWQKRATPLVARLLRYGYGYEYQIFDKLLGKRECSELETSQAKRKASELTARQRIFPASDVYSLDCLH